MLSEKSKLFVQKMGFKLKLIKRVIFVLVEDRLNNNGSDDFKSFVNFVCEERQDLFRIKRFIN